MEKVVEKVVASCSWEFLMAKWSAFQEGSFKELKFFHIE